MKTQKYTTLILSLIFLGATFIGCTEDNHVGDEIFNQDTIFPYVFLQDRNEDLDGNTGNNFWSYNLTPENDGFQVRVDYGSQDVTIVKHDIIIGFDSANSPPEDGVILRTITDFPSEIIITKDDLANALGVPLETLNSGTLYFGGRSENSAGQIVENPDDLEDFLVWERHAYYYRWNLSLD